MKRILNSLMAKLGYFPAPVAASIRSLTIEIDSSQVDAALEKLGLLASAAKHAEGAFKGAAASTPSSAARIATLAAFADLAPAVTAAAEKRFAANPFAPTFELDPGEDAVTITLYPRPGSVQYLVNVTGPHSSAVKFEGALPKLVQVSAVVESPR